MNVDSLRELIKEEIHIFFKKQSISSRRWTYFRKWNNLIRIIRYFWLLWIWWF